MKRFARIIGVSLVVGIMSGGAIVEAKDRPLKQLPKDIWSLVCAWTEPVKAVAEETRQFDPISGLWFGLVDGSVKSVERTAEIFLPPGKDAPTPAFKQGKAILRYSF